MSVCTAFVKDVFGKGQIKEQGKMLFFQWWIKSHGCSWAAHCFFLWLAIDVGQLTHGYLIEFILWLNA